MTFQHIQLKKKKNIEKENETPQDKNKSAFALCELVHKIELDNLKIKLTLF